MATIKAYATKAGQRYRVRYRGPDGRQTDKRGFSTKAAAQGWLHANAVEISRGSYISPTAARTTVADVADAWIHTISHLKRTTHSSDLSALNTHVLPKWGTTAASALRRPAIKAWLPTVGNPPTQARVLHIMRQLVRHAVDDGKMTGNPTEGIKIARGTHKPRGYLNDGQVAQLAAAMKQPEDQTLVEFLAYTGVRFGEGAAARLSAFNTLRRRVDIIEAQAEVSGELVVSGTKTHKRRSVPYPSFLSEPLAALMVGKDRDDLVFARAGTQLRLSNWRPRVFEPAVAACIAATEELREEERRTSPTGEPTTPVFPRITPHDLRHTAASLAIAAGANVKAVQTMLGHASAAMTLDIYADLFDDDLDAVASAMEARRAHNLPTLAHTTTV